MRELADLLDKTSANIADIYSRRSGRPADEHRKAMQAETWYTDQEAVDAGLADSVLGDVTDANLHEIQATAMAVHHTGTEDSAWDGGAAEKSYPAKASTLSKVYAWKNADGDPNQKSTYKFPHHHKAGGPANLPACRNGLARLSGANIPDADRAGVKAHLQAHLDDASQSDAMSWDDLDIDLEAIRQALKGAS
jgi:Clp protease